MNDKYTVICIGSNTATKHKTVAGILSELQSMLTDFHCSDIYENDDDTGLGAPYANAVCSGIFDGSYEALAGFASAREKEFGRTPQSKPSGIMPLDIDIIVFAGNLICRRQSQKPYFLFGLKQIPVRHHTCLLTPKS